MAGKIFLSYRREDTAGFAGRIYDRLEQSFPAESLFMDVAGGIGAGQDFVRVIEEQVRVCDAMLVLIGPNWLTIRDDNGPRLENPEDFVRIEVESALRLGKRVIPVLVQKTEMPRANALPEPLKPLARRNAVGLTHERFRADTQGLIKALEEALADVEKANAQEVMRVEKELSTSPDASKTVAAAKLVSPSRKRIKRRLTTRLLSTFAGHAGKVTSVAYSPDGRSALSGSEDGTLKLWDLATGMEIRSFDPPTSRTCEISSVAFSPDGQTALSGGYNITLELWDVTEATVIRTFEVHSVLRGFSSVAFSPDGLTALSGSEADRAYTDHSLQLWDIATGKEIRRIAARTSVLSVAFSPDGQTALSGGEDTNLKLWDMAGGKLWRVVTGGKIRSFRGHTHWVSSVAFSPTGETALSGSVDKTLKLWDISTGGAPDVLWAFPWC